MAPINWYHQASSTYFPATPPADLTWDRQTFQCLSPDTTLDAMRNPPGIPHLQTERYPALAMPEGPEDRLVLPSEHQDFFFDLLHAAQEIDVLVIGYSGLDKEILRLIASTKRKIRRMTVVSHDQIAGTEVLERFQAAGLEPLWPNVIDGDFASWSNDGGLNQLIEEYDGPYG